MALERAEREVADAKTKSDKIDPRLEEALANALVPLERTFQDAIKQASVMAETSRLRMEALKAELAQVELEISKLDTLSIDDIAEQHKDWNKKAEDRINRHIWNVEGDVPDPEAHH